MHFVTEYANGQAKQTFEYEDDNVGQRTPILASRLKHHFGWVPATALDFHHFHAGL